MKVNVYHSPAIFQASDHSLDENMVSPAGMYTVGSQPL